MQKFHIIVIGLMILSFSSWAKTVAKVKMIRGDVKILTLGKTEALKLDADVEAGSVIKTSEKSVVKLRFTDDSQMNIGPLSEMKIEQFSSEDPGIIDLVKGQIRSQVTKDYHKIKKGGSKLFIKTPNAVMGVRGTEFAITSHGDNTVVLLVEGTVVFNNQSEVGVSTSERLESIVNEGEKLQGGQFSAVQGNTSPTIPSTLSPKQMEALEKNPDFENERLPQSTEDSAKKSVVPEGLNGQVVSNDPETLNKEIAEVASMNTDPKTEVTDKNPEGYIQGDKVKPANGSFVHLDSGLIIPPGPGAVFDKNTNSYIASAENGSVSSDGNYQPPRNVEITSDGKIFVTVKDASGVSVVKEVPAPSPIVVSTPVVKSVEAINASAGSKVSTVPPPVQNVFLNSQFAPNGLNDLKNIQNGSVSGAATQTEAVQNQVSDRSRTTIKVTGPSGN